MGPRERSRGPPSQASACSGVETTDTRTSVLTAHLSLIHCEDGGGMVEVGAWHWWKWVSG